MGSLTLRRPQRGHQHLTDPLQPPGQERSRYAGTVDFSSLPPGDAELPVPVHQPGDEHCGVGGAPKPGHPSYRRCRCGLWYHWTGSRWRPGRPSAHWLREHGLGDNSADFWSPADHRERGASSARFVKAAGRWRYLLRSMLHH
jgi:hypothetical protein